MKKILIIGVALLAGCSTPKYGRSVSRIYDASGKLVQTVVTERVEQPDANQVPMLKVLKNQTYRK